MNKNSDKRAMELLSQDLDNIVEDLDLWAEQNETADSQDLQDLLSRIANVADTLRQLSD